MGADELKPIFSRNSDGRPIPSLFPMDGTKKDKEYAPREELGGSTSTSADGSDSSEETSMRKNGLSSFGAGLNFVKGMLGPGCLSIPFIFRQAGLLMGIILIILFGLITTHCMHKLVDCSQYLSKRKGHHSLDYGAVAFETCAQGPYWIRPYGRMARFVSNLSIVALQLGICSVSVVFIAAHLREICSELFDDTMHLSQQQWILIITLPLVLICFIRSLHNIVFLSIIGSLLMFGSLFIIFQYLLRMDHKPLEELRLFTDIEGVFSASGAVLYAFEGQAMVLPLENKLRHPSRMNAILSWAMSFVSLIYTICGVAGYATYGDQVRASIALNLPPQQIPFTIVRLMLSLVVFFGFVMQQYVLIAMLWPRLRDLMMAKRESDDGIMPPAQFCSSSQRKRLFWELVFRAGMALLSVLLAYSVPNLERIIPLVGMSAGMLLAVVFPALLDTFTFISLWLANPLRWIIRLALNSLYILIGISALVGGVHENLMELINR